MRLLHVVQVLIISSYGERHLVKPSHLKDGVTAFHVFSPWTVLPGNVLYLDCRILWIMWQYSMCCLHHTIYGTVGRSFCPYVCMTLVAPMCDTNNEGRYFYIQLFMSRECLHWYRLHIQCVKPILLSMPANNAGIGGIRDVRFPGLYSNV